MVRTQIYLSDSQSEGIKSLATQTGKKQSELIREAIEVYLDNNQVEDKKKYLKFGFDLWKDRNDIIDINEFRKNSDRV